jgi:hypothetical protein
MDDSRYVSLSQRGRDAWFYAIRAAERSDVWAVLASSTAGDGARGQPPAASLSVGAAGEVRMSRRAVSAVADSVAEARARGRRYVWLPILIVGNEAHGGERHANSLWVDLAKAEAWVFEPHGGDVDDARQAASFRHFYGRESYEECLHQLVGDELALHVPHAFMPAVFGQALTGDRWCALWGCLFLDGATRLEGGPAAFVAAWAGADRARIEGALATPAEWMVLHAQYLRTKA